MLGKEQLCGVCAFYLADDKKQGVCRLHPPALIFLGMNPSRTGGAPTPVRISMWPEVTAAQWCGDFRPREPN